MENKELEKEITDEKTGISYTLVGDYYLPNLKLEQEEKVQLNKYGLLRLDYLKKHKKAELSIMFMDMTLNKHLKEVQELAQTRVNELVEQLKAKSGLTEDMKNTDMLYWVGTMNAIKNQAEEIVLKEWIEFRGETAFCEITPQDKKYCIYFDEIAEKILKNVPKQNKKYVQKQLDQLDKNFMDYLYYWNEKYYRNGFADVIELLEL